MLAAFACISGPLHAADALVPVEGDGFIGAAAGGRIVFSYQKSPLAKPRGGAKLAGSAFIHPLRTPSGFVLTDCQPADHLHHFGVWWPWKFVEVDGKRHVTWELQQGQGEHRAKSARLISNENGKLTWEFDNETMIRSKGVEDRPVIAEKVVASLNHDKKAAAYVIDFEIRQQALGPPVTIAVNHYSGFCWRGPAAWTKDSSVMRTSAGKGRDDANGTTARWVMVSGPTPIGKATMLMLSAASDITGGEEKLRVWDSKAHAGVPFINFNPVADKALLLSVDNKAVSHRKYRIIAADRELDAAAAEQAWRDWLGR